ncbi:MAG: hypothetical protein ACI8Y7_000932 [Candidatus Woesearchaeota archaeon]|jgi:hypothetical protein
MADATPKKNIAAQELYIDFKLIEDYFTNNILFMRSQFARDMLLLTVYFRTKPLLWASFTKNFVATFANGQEQLFMDGSERVVKKFIDEKVTCLFRDIDTWIQLKDVRVTKKEVQNAKESAELLLESLGDSLNTIMESINLTGQSRKIQHQFDVFHSKRRDVCPALRRLIKIISLKRLQAISVLMSP